MSAPLDHPSAVEAEIQAAVDACAAAGHPLKHERYVRRALAARVEQGLAVAIEDTPTLVFLADVLSQAEPVDQGGSVDEPAA